MADSLRTTAHLWVHELHLLLKPCRGLWLDEAPKLVLSGAKEVFGPNMGVLPVHRRDSLARQVEVDILGVDALQYGASSSFELVAWSKLDVVEERIANDVRHCPLGRVQSCGIPELPLLFKSPLLLGRVWKRKPRIAELDSFPRVDFDVSLRVDLVAKRRRVVSGWAIHLLHNQWWEVLDLELEVSPILDDGVRRVPFKEFLVENADISVGAGKERRSVVAEQRFPSCRGCLGRRTGLLGCGRQRGGVRSGLELLRGQFRLSLLLRARRRGGNGIGDRGRGSLGGRRGPTLR